MNREAIFRGKSVETNEWVYGAYVLEKYSNTPYICYFEYGTFVTLKQIEVHPETIGEFIGLNDRCNKLIFEGDIAEIDGEEFPFLIEYDTQDAIWLATNSHGVLSFRDDITGYDCGVTGNIYDNPDLLSERLQ